MNHKQEVVSFELLMPMIEDSFRQGLTVTIPITGNSMRPLLWHKRDSVILAPCDATTLKRGDVPLYQRENGQYVLHRIFRVYKDSYTMLGDAQTDPEVGIGQQQIRAVMVAYIRKGKQVPCTRWWYRCFVVVWRWCRPIRPFLFTVWKRLRGGR